MYARRLHIRTTSSKIYFTSCSSVVYRPSFVRYLCFCGVGYTHFPLWLGIITLLDYPFEGRQWPGGVKWKCVCVWGGGGGRGVGTITKQSWQSFEILCWSAQWRSSTPLPGFHRPALCTFCLENGHCYSSPEKSASKQLNDLRPVALTQLLVKSLERIQMLFNPCLIHDSLPTGLEGVLKMPSCSFGINCLSTWSCCSFILESSLLTSFLRLIQCNLIF